VFEVRAAGGGVEMSRYRMARRPPRRRAGAP
jgi:hypothetical protein